MKYSQPSFTVAVGGQAYAEGWDRVFAKPEPAPEFFEPEEECDAVCIGCQTAFIVPAVPPPADPFVCQWCAND